MARLPKAVRDLVVRRAGGRCEYCRSPAAFAHQSFSIEHIRPRVRRGRDSAGNLALSCQGCNNHKYDRTRGRDPVSGREVRLFHPAGTAGGNHFAWTEDGTVVLGLTPTGRATVETLQLNREPLVNLRRVLVEVGEHPPDA